jgi:AbrB family looped-hinge helix DNA binding protein
MRVTSKGQVTIPIAIRKKVGILPDTDLEFGLRGETITIKKKTTGGRRLTRGEEIVARARGKGSANRHLTTDQIMALTRGWGEDDFDR